MISRGIKSIVLVDDDYISNLLSKLFIDQLDLDIEVDVALNGQEALDLIFDKKVPLQSPCLLLLDINMPKMNGWEFLELYDGLVGERTQNEIVIVMLTVSEEQSDMIKAMDNPHITEFVKKPLSEKVFTRLINKHFTSEFAS